MTALTSAGSHGKAERFECRADTPIDGIVVVDSRARDVEHHQVDFHLAATFPANFGSRLGFSKLVGDDLLGQAK